MPQRSRCVGEFVILALERAVPQLTIRHRQRELGSALALALAAALVGNVPSASAKSSGADRRSHLESALDDLATQAPRTAVRWETLWTANFRVLHRDIEAGRRLARAAERIREDLLRQWTGEEYPLPWTRRADLYLFASFDELNAMTGGQPKAGSSLVQPSKLYRGRILSRRVNLAGDDPELLTSTLPHELTHVVLGDLLGGSIPLWANEGAASAAESPGKLRYYRHVLRSFVVRGQVYKLRDLLGMQNYPDDPYRSLFYAESNVLFRYLLRIGSRDKALRFLRLASASGYDVALRQVYGMLGLAELQRRWSAELSRMR